MQAIGPEFASYSLFLTTAKILLVFHHDLAMGLVPPRNEVHALHPTTTTLVYYMNNILHIFVSPTPAQLVSQCFKLFCADGVCAALCNCVEDCGSVSTPCETCWQNEEMLSVKSKAVRKYKQ